MSRTLLARNATLALVAGVLGSLIPASPSVAAPGQDSVTANVTTFGTDISGFEDNRWEIAATSGPDGEDAAGSVQAETLRTTGPEPFLDGPVACLAVQGNVALIVVSPEPTFGSISMRITDNAGTGVADLIESTITSDPAAAACAAPEPQYIRRDRVTEGDIVIVDASAAPTSKDQCHHGGWKAYGTAFENQGQCVAFVQRGPKP